jgi:copper chaperone CopZ
MKQDVKVNNMNCDGCANTVKERFQGIPHVKSIEIDLDNQTAIIESDERISDKLLEESLEGTSYSIAL